MPPPIDHWYCFQAQKHFEEAASQQARCTRAREIAAEIVSGSSLGVGGCGRGRW